MSGLGASTSGDGPERDRKKMLGSFRLHDDTQPETKQQTDFALERIAHLLPLLELGSARPGLEQAPQEMGLNETERRC